MVNYKLQSNMLEVVDNQIKANDPKCTKKTYLRLLDLGYTKDESRKLIASVILEEMYDMMKNKVVFDEKRFAKKLAMLPDYYAEENDMDDQVVHVPVKKGVTIGRNDLCPCGSGKKYKKCCGKSS